MKNLKPDFLTAIIVIFITLGFSYSFGSTVLKFGQHVRVEDHNSIYDGCWGAIVERLETLNEYVIDLTRCPLVEDPHLRISEKESKLKGF